MASNDREFNLQWPIPENACGFHGPGVALAHGRFQEKIDFANRGRIETGGARSRSIAMNLRKAWPIVLVGTVIVLVVAAGARTLMHHGPAAVEQMNGEERALLTRLETIRKGMSPAVVASILGEPNDAGPLGLRPMWQVGSNPLNAIAVYFMPDGAYRILWIHAGQFLYERNL